MPAVVRDRKSTRLNSSHEWISYAVFCLKKKMLGEGVGPFKLVDVGLRVAALDRAVEGLERIGRRVSGTVAGRPERKAEYNPFFFYDPATTEIYTLSLHDALPISARSPSQSASKSSRPRRCSSASAEASRA